MFTWWQPRHEPGFVTIETVQQLKKFFEDYPSDMKGYRPAVQVSFGIFAELIRRIEELERKCGS